MEIEMSALPKTWILDLDGTVVRHNGYKTDGRDSLLENADRLLSQIREEDMLIFVTSRKREYKEMTERFLDENGIRYDHIIYEAPCGERILVNDEKPSGLRTAYAINTRRNEICTAQVTANPAL
ncbi:MAG: hypothetical protein NC337_06980 [Roseburia sp.]|nr:hypothetical protein [Roseburia sp.]